MSDFKNQLSFSKKEQYALILLLIITFILIGLNLIPDLFVQSKVFSPQQLEAIIARHEEELQTLSQNTLSHEFDVIKPDQSVLEQRLTPFPFNPNRLPDSSWRRMGLTENQIRNIKNYESKGGKFYRKEDLKKIYTISEKEYAILEPFIMIPSYGSQRVARASLTESTVNAEPVPETINSAKYKPEIVELNKADSLMLIQLPMVGPWFAHRIIKYREILGGFVDKEQLLEVFGMDQERVSAFEDYLTIDTSRIHPLSINFVDFKDVVRHPYFSYPFTKAIFNHRDRKGMISNFDQLKELVPDSDTLSPYLRYYIKF
ncbi:MAG: helix-hairpin-helix domain-containing protein [Bacteroidales bacterium]|nr:helix-hairpin-helix domain-containing protein [Bacteroidales bacterium]